MNDGFVIRNMTRDELDVAAGWAAREGWNPGLGDADAFFAADPDGFYIGLLNGKPVASISCVTYSPHFAFLGFYIVQPEQRGKGLGLRIWRHAMERCKASNVGLDGVVEQQDNYRRSGFVLAHRNVRYGGAARALASGGAEHRLRAIETDLDAVLEYDRGVFPAARPAFLQRWLQRPDTHTLLCPAGGDALGYGVIRPAQDGHRIGPLFADSPEVARSLLAGLGGRVPADSPVYIDVPLANQPAVEMVAGMGLTPAFESARMYTGGEPAMPTGKVYGITSLELG